MAFCSKCGAAIADDAAFCSMCGEKVLNVTEEIRETPSAAAEEIREAPSVSPETREGGIMLANKLANQYETLEKLKDEITDIEFNIKKTQVSSTPPRYSTFRFFWPFFIIALGVSFAVTLVSALFAASVNSEGLLVLSEILGYLSIPVVLLIGLFVAKARRNAANEELEAKEMTIMRKVDDMHKRVVELRNRQSRINIELAEYKDLVPMTMRNKNQMLRVKTLLETGRAQTFEEAVEMIKHPSMA